MITIHDNQGNQHFYHSNLSSKIIIFNIIIGKESVEMIKRK